MALDREHRQSLVPSTSPALSDHCGPLHEDGLLRPRAASCFQSVRLTSRVGPTQALARVPRRLGFYADAAARQLELTRVLFALAWCLNSKSQPGGDHEGTVWQVLGSMLLVVVAPSLPGSCPRS